MKKIIVTLLIVLGLTLCAVALSLKTFPDWLSIPGGILVLLGIAFNAVLDVGSKFRDWIELLFGKEEKDENISNKKTSYNEINQVGNTNIATSNIEHLEIHNKPNPAKTQLTERSQNLELDRVVYKRLVAILPWNSSILFIRQRNFAGLGFLYEDLNGLFSLLEECKNPAFEFIDSDLEDLRKNLIENITHFLNVIRLETYPTNRIGYSAVPPEWEYEHPEHFNKVVQDLEGTASQIGKNYDTLIKMGRRKLGVK